MHHTRLISCLLASCFLAGHPAYAQEASDDSIMEPPPSDGEVIIDTEGEEWVPYTGADKLHEFMDGLVAEQVYPDGTLSRGVYQSDGTGYIEEWGVKFPRRWEVHGEDQVCIITIRDIACFSLEQNVANPYLFRLYDPEKNRWDEFKVTEGTVITEAERMRQRKKGTAANASAAELAMELMNPNTALGIMTTLYDYTTFDGDLPGANKQTAQSITFQPSLPYPLEEGRNFFTRPAIPIIIEQPILDPVTGRFEDAGAALGDISYDVSMGFTFSKPGKGKNIILAGVSGTIPTATDDAIASDQWLLGPQIAGALLRKWGSVSLLMYHQWEVAGSNKDDTEITGGQYVYNINLVDGWQITGSPTFSYDHHARDGDELTFPLAIGVAKASIIYGKPWTFSIEYWNYIDSSDPLGQDQQIRFSIAPVLPLPW